MSVSRDFVYARNGSIDNISEGPRLEEDKPSTQRRILGCLRSNLLVIFLILAMIAGIVIGLVIREVDPSFTHDERRRMYLKFCGDLLLNVLKMIILPLVFTSLVAGMANLPSQAAGKVGGRAVAYYMLTTFLAVLLGILLVSTIKPGDRGDDNIDKENRNTILKPVDAILDLVRNMFPPNLVQACTEQRKTFYETVDSVTYENVTFFNDTSGMNEMRTEMNIEKIITSFSVGWKSGTNILGIVLFSIVLGIVIGRMGEDGRSLHIFFDRLQQAIIQIVHLIIWFSPVGVMCLLAERIVRMEDPAKSFEQLTYYMLTVLLGIFIHAVIFLPTIYFFFTRSNPFKLALQMGEALLTAWGTASSSATLPVTLKCIEEKAGVHKTVSRFVLPVGATINMDGTALYEAVAAIFIAQYNDITLDAGQVVTTAITATLAAIGAAGVPEGGLVTMIIVLTAVGLPVDDIGLIYAVDWFLDRFRTATNVWGDSVGARIVEHLSKKELEQYDRSMEDQKHDMHPVKDVYVIDQPQSLSYNPHAKGQRTSTDL